MINKFKLIDYPRLFKFKKANHNGFMLKENQFNASFLLNDFKENNLSLKLFNDNEFKMISNSNGVWKTSIMIERNSKLKQVDIKYNFYSQNETLIKHDIIKHLKYTYEVESQDGLLLIQKFSLNLIQIPNTIYLFISIYLS